jgi:drug/metabolite transporter (DMT)-like permease
MLIALATVLDGSFFYAEVALEEMPPLTIALHRVFWAIPNLLVIVKMRGLSMPTSPHIWGALLGLASLSTALAYVLYFAMLARAGAANLLLVTLLIPPFAIALGGVFLGEQITTAAWIGFAIIAFGSAANDGRAAQYLLARMKTGRPNS